MTQWQRISAHLSIIPNVMIMELYPEAFPIEVRHYLAGWIEEQAWEEINVDSKEIPSEARRLQEYILGQLHSMTIQNPNVVENIKLQQIYSRMGEVNPLDLVRTVRDTLRQERQWLQQVYPQVPLPVNGTPQRTVDTSTHDVDSLLIKVMEIQRCRQQLHQVQEELNWEKQEAEQGDMDGSQNSVRQNRIAQLDLQFQEYAQSRIQLLQETVCNLGHCQNNLLSQIESWRWAQLRSTIGWAFDDDLLPLQRWCEQLLDVNGNLRQELMLVKRDHGTIKEFQQLEENLNILLQKLVHGSLVVEKQPPQVIKTQSKFCSSVRYLLGEKMAPGKPVVMKAQIITESQARHLGQGLIPSENVGELLNNTAILESNTASKSTCSNFRHMCIKKIKRADRKGSESVTEEKFAVLFTAELTITGCDTPYNIQMTSLPVVVIVHGSQENNAMATIIWDCAFSEPKRIPFVVPDRVPWSQMCEALSRKFMSEVQTTRVLDNYNLQCLAQKIFDRPGTNESCNNLTVSWAQFNKEVLPGRNFTFWQWFEGVIDLTKKCLKDYWSKGLIFGFIGKQHLHVILQEQPSGTFLLRFSDSEIGGITIAYVGQIENGGRRIQNIQPFTKKDLDSVGLGDRIRDISCISHLYDTNGYCPKDKHEAFKKFFTVVPPSNPDGYLPFKLTTVVDPDPGLPIKPQPESTPPNPTFSNLMPMPSQEIASTFNHVPMRHIPTPEATPSFDHNIEFVSQYPNPVSSGMMYPSMFNNSPMIQEPSSNMELDEILLTLNPQL